MQFQLPLPSSHVFHPSRILKVVPSCGEVDGLTAMTVCLSRVRWSEDSHVTLTGFVHANAAAHLQSGPESSKELRLAPALLEDENGKGGEDFGCEAWATLVLMNGRVAHRVGSLGYTPP